MSEKKLRFSLPGFNWIDSRLSRKVIVVLVLLALVGWLLSGVVFLRYLRSYAGKAFDESVRQASETADQAAAFLSGSGGECSGLEDYLPGGVACMVWNDSGELIYGSASNDPDDAAILPSAMTQVTLPGGESLIIHIFMPPIERKALVDTIGDQAKTGLLFFNFFIVIAAGVLLYLLFISPIVSLRKKMALYSEKGTLPQRSTRIDEIGKLQNGFADLTGVLHAKEQSERRLIASISHDIKTPLTSILGYSQRLGSAQLSDEKRSQYINAIHDRGLAIKSIVDEFDDYLDAGLRDSSPMELLTAGALCSSIEKEYREELMDAEVRLEVSCACPEARLICNMPHMKRYFGNLIGNSISHGEAKDLILRLECYQRDHDIIFDFSDNGRGVPPELLQSIFEPLYTTDRGRKVSGLGLSICRSIITAHGGRVIAEDIPSGGLLVRASLPCADFIK